ncbi:hypothetical protein ACHHYP_15121 [Achlya hypogyna]|uniref:Uncharacterized protein n=1 Tax=Achlya hypogyna TaxID=1202772 RepID=A0A1V9YBK0_ACHHY|nr:hypothetical protein ACHHYP_15121 [Achlya hypogyna]
MLELGDKLGDSLALVTSDIWVGALTKLKGYEDAYLNDADTEYLAEDDEEDCSDDEDDIVTEFLGATEL